MPVAAADRFSISDFDRNGFAGPFDTGLDAEWVAELGDRYSRVVIERHQHPIYGRYAQRDWHLVDRDVARLLTAPLVVQRVVDALGPDLLLWRSKIFYKPSGGDAIGWHQEWGSFNGEEIGNAVPSLEPADPDSGIWDVTVWIACSEVGVDNGPMQFVPGSNHERIAWESVPMTESAFFENPFEGLDAGEIVKRTLKDELLLDINTDQWLAGVAPETLSRDQLVAHLTSKAAALKAKFTDYNPDPSTVVTMPMHAGQFVIFSERTMHGSPANMSSRHRIAINARFAKADTLIYPSRLEGQYTDGSNLDISRHASLLVSGSALESRNVLTQPDFGQTFTSWSGAGGR